MAKVSPVVRTAIVVGVGALAYLAFELFAVGAAGPGASASAPAGGGAAGGGSAAGGGAGSPGPSGAPGGPAGAGGRDAGGADGPGADVPLADLAQHLGATVRVGGLVTATGPDGVRLDDGTATARLVLEGDAAGLAALLQPGDALNATGTPEERGEVVFVVGDPAGIVLLGDLGGDEAGGDASADPSADAAALGALLEGEDGPLDGGATALAGALRATRGPDPMTAGLATLVLTVGLGAGIALYRARVARRRSRARIQARIDAIAAPGPGGGLPATPA